MPGNLIVAPPPHPQQSVVGSINVKPGIGIILAFLESKAAPSVALLKGRSLPNQLRRVGQGAGKVLDVVGIAAAIHGYVSLKAF
jgi:hypothetical protein